MIQRLPFLFGVVCALVMGQACSEQKPLSLEDSKISDQRKVCDENGENCLNDITIGGNKLTCQLAASTSKINRGQPVTLTISTATAIQSATINSMTIADINNPQLSLSPTATTNYEAVITDASGATGKCSARVEVVEGGANPLPTCQLTASKTTINEGESTTISMTTMNATSGILIDTTLAGSAGSRSVSPTVTTTFEGKVSGAGGNNTCSIGITVIPRQVVTPGDPPTCSLSASSSSIQRGSSVSLTMTSQNATSAVLQGMIVSVGTATKSFSPTATTTYEGAVTGAGGVTNTCQVTVNVTEPPPSAPNCTISRSASKVVAGSSVTISYTTSNATSATLNGVSVATGSGSRIYNPTASTNYDLVVTGAGGSKTCSTSVDAGPLPTCTITSAYTLVTSGNNTTLTMTTSNATSAKAHGLTFPAAGGSQSYRVTAKTILRGEVTNAYGSATCDGATIQVIVNMPTCGANQTCSCPSGYIGHSATVTSNYCQIQNAGDYSFYCKWQSYAGLPCAGCNWSCRSQ